MTLSECYAAMGADYDTALSRLHSDELIKKIILKFPAQSGYKALCDAMDAGDYKSAFMAVHTMKGICLNLNLTQLAKSTSDLTEALRPGVFNPEDTPLFEAVKADYSQTCAAIAALE